MVQMMRQLLGVQVLLKQVRPRLGNSLELLAPSLLTVDFKTYTGRPVLQEIRILWLT